jgi:hypothetical protein
MLPAVAPSGLGMKAPGPTDPTMLTVIGVGPGTGSGLAGGTGDGAAAGSS